MILSRYKNSKINKVNGKYILDNYPKFSVIKISKQINVPINSIVRFLKFNNVKMRCASFFNKKPLNIKKTKEQYKEYSKNYYLLNKDRIKDYRKQLYLKNKQFYKNQKKKNYLKHIAQRRKYAKLNKDKLKQYFIEYRLKNLKTIKEKRKQYYIKNHDKIMKYRKNNRDLINKTQRKYLKSRKKSDPIYKLSVSIRVRLNSFLKLQNLSKKYKLSEYLGCTLGELKQHLELKFTEGMTWKNHSRTGWHIDHIIPLISAKTEEEIYKLSHYTNLQPLWATDNLSKRGFNL